MGGGSWSISRCGLVMVLVVAMVSPLTLGAQPEKCRLFQVTSSDPSPTLKVAGNHGETYISLDLLFENATADITISVGNGSSCQITVDRANGTLKGDCFKPKEIPLKCSEVGGLNTVVLKRNRKILTVIMQGDNSDLKVLSLKAKKDEGIEVKVNSDSIINTAFNCPSHCFKFNNAIIHSKENLTLSALQTGDGQGGEATGVIKVLYGEDWNEEKEFNFTYPQTQSGVKVNDVDGWEKFYAESTYRNVTNDSVPFVAVSGSLIESSIPDPVGTVPSFDTYFKFENMDTIEWQVCEEDHVNPREGRKYQDPVQVTDVTTAMYSDISTIVDGETGNGTDAPTTIVPETNSGDTTIDSGLVPTTIKRETEEMSCKDTWEPKCSLTANDGGSCNCGEAKAKGWCDQLDTYPAVKEHCKKTCGLCPGQESRRAVCDLQSSDPDSMNVTGLIEITQDGTNEPVFVSGIIHVYTGQNVTGKHGFHIHEKAIPSIGECAGAAGHYNPFMKNHSAPDTENRHVGDLGNIMVTKFEDGSYTSTLEIKDFQVTLFGNFSVVGRSIVLHEGEDDLGLGGHGDSLTTGHAGARIACCTIKLVEQEATEMPVTTVISGGNTGGIDGGTPKPVTAHGGFAVYIILGVVAAVLLMLLIWILTKKRKSSRTVDLEGQNRAITAQESTEKPDENKTDTDETKTQDQAENNKGTENTAFQEQEDVKKDAEIVDEKVTKDDNSASQEQKDVKKDAEIVDEKGNKDDVNKTIKDSSSASNENDNITDDSNNKDTEKTNEEGIDDGSLNKKDVDESPQEEIEKNTITEKEDEPEKKNENDSPTYEQIC